MRMSSAPCGGAKPASEGGVTRALSPQMRNPCLESPRHRGKARTGGRVDSGEVRILGRQRDREVEGLLLVVVSVHLVHDLHARVRWLLQLLPEGRDPGVLGGAEEATVHEHAGRG